MMPSNVPPDPVGPLYAIHEQVREMGDAVAQAARQREEIARQIGRVAVQGTALIQPHPWS